MHKYLNLYQQVYDLLQNRTPLMFDCGELCGSACCRNNGKGMLLFPYEDVYLSSIDNDFRIENSHISVDGYTVKILYCTGTCDRKTRPVSCRIFPLFPFIYEDTISVEFDPRANGTCPLLLTDLEGIYMSAVFRLMVYKATALLSEEPLIRKFMIKLTNELHTINKFQ